MYFLQNFVIGITIGSGAILPGISSGVFCVIFGIYEKLIDSVLHFFQTPHKNIKFLLPIIFGIFIGIFIFSKILNYFLLTFPLQTKSIFIGLILGSIPSLLKEINRNSDFKLHYLLYTLITFIFGIVSVFLEKNISNNIGFETFSYTYLFLAGFTMSIGIVVPGVSSTVILMLMGVYTNYLTSISSLYLPTLIPMGIGLVLGSFIFMKITNHLIKKYYPQTFYSIIGFTLGSILVLFPKISFDISGIISFICIILGIIFFNLFKLST